jgi:hypothetical protein
MSKKMREPSVTARKSYSPPSLSIYGGMAALTASGSAPVGENQGSGFPAKMA